MSAATRFLPRRLALAFAACIAAPLIAGCASTNTFAPNALDAHSRAAAEITTLWWVMFALGLGVFLLVTALLFAALLTRRQREADAGTQRGKRWLLYGGLILPIGVLSIVFVFTLRAFQVMAQDEDAPLVIEVVGRMWWWEVRYPQFNIITANEIHIPVDTTVEFRLTSAEVIHSFWLPELHGKMDMIPGHTNTLQIRADEARTYRGLCAEFCGLQHARMHFLLIAQEAADFNEWVLRQQQPATTALTDSAQRGYAVFFEASCHTCHAISGTPAVSAFGPNLTHFASRQTLGAVSLINNRGNLGGWVLNAQAIKPGALMPPMDIPAADVQPLLDYLESLR